MPRAFEEAVRTASPSWDEEDKAQWDWVSGPKPHRKSVPGPE